MSNRITQNVCLALCSLAILVCGCAKDPGPPPPLAVENIPGELEKAFQAAKQQTKDIVGKVNSGLQSKDYPGAYDAIQALGSLPDTSIEQRRLTARAMLTIYGLLQTAQSQGDDKAAAALRYHQMTK